MKITYEELQGKPRILQSLTGLNHQEFEALLLSFEEAWDTFVDATFQQKSRQRAYGAGRTWKLVQVLSACPSLEFMIDRTERPINRPKDKEDRKTYYSGKKKAHTVKNNIISARRGKVLFLSDTYEGKKHDKKIADEEEYEFPEGSTLLLDTGFQGFNPTGVMRQQPKKKPRNGKLTDEEKEENRAISKVRVEVEHQIGGIKRCQIVVQKFRNRVEHYVDDVMETACGLHNFRLTHRQKRGAALTIAA
jgi:DDE superfamily endonuclease